LQIVYIQLPLSRNRLGSKWVFLTVAETTEGNKSEIDSASIRKIADVKIIFSPKANFFPKRNPLFIIFILKLEVKV
jgi:hypothetical protein